MKVKSVSINNKRAYGFSSKQELLDFINGKKKILIALNAEKLNGNNEELNNIINKNIGYPDGIGAVMALKRKGINSRKIAGAEFWLEIVKEFEDSKTFYLIGGEQDIIDKTVLLLKENHPKIRILGYRNGFLQPKDEKKILNDLLEKKPDVIFVAMGSPRQELLMNRFSDKYQALYMGLGGSFDVFTGSKKRAPKIYQKLGLEWLYRVLKEPTRWKRQKSLFSFLMKVLFNKI